MQTNENFNQLFDRITRENSKLKSPLELLVGLANGYDLSEKSLVYELALKFKKEYGDNLPDEYDYDELLELIFDTYEYSTVSIKDQLAAQKTLVEYQHPKRKSVEVNTVGDAGAISALTAKEANLFWKKFNDKY